jgi:hypothetical protein
MQEKHRNRFAEHVTELDGANASTDPHGKLKKE